MVIVIEDDSGTAQAWSTTAHYRCMMYCRPPKGCGSDVARGNLIADHSFFLLTCANPKPDDERMACHPSPRSSTLVANWLRARLNATRKSACLPSHKCPHGPNESSSNLSFLLMIRRADSNLRFSQVVPHPSINQAMRRLTLEVERDLVHSTRSGHQR